MHLLGCLASDTLPAIPDDVVAGLPASDEARILRDIRRRTADLALVTPAINTNPLPDYDYDKLGHAMNNGIAMTPKGRLYASWVAGEDGPNAFFVFNRSDDRGETWSKPCFVIDGRSPNLPAARTTLIGTLWTDPRGCLWVFFQRSCARGNEHDGRAGVWAAVCANPDDVKPVWSEPRRLFHGCPLNKPVVLRNGAWLLATSLPPGADFPELKPYVGANILESRDEGATWKWLSCADKFTDWDYNEPVVTELRDGRLWLLSRTWTGPWQCFSSDGGRSWSGYSPSAIKHPVSRFQLFRLASGRILLVKHGDTVGTTDGRRNKLKAFLSEDDGRTWIGGLTLHEGYPSPKNDQPWTRGHRLTETDVSYPDGFQAPDGVIFISYDYSRRSAAEILMSRFTEADVLAGKIVTPGSKLNLRVCKCMAKNHGK
jgi:hypothetical protein